MPERGRPRPHECGSGYAHTDGEDAKFEAVTLDEVKVAAQKYLKSEALVISVVKPGKP